MRFLVNPGPRGVKWTHQWPWFDQRWWSGRDVETRILSLPAGASGIPVWVLMDVGLHGTESGRENETADHDRGHQVGGFSQEMIFVQVVRRPAHREPRGSQGTVALSLARLPGPLSQAVPNAGETMTPRQPPGNGDVCHKGGRWST